MSSKELETWVKDAKQKGYSEQQIIGFANKAGYPAADVQRIIDQLDECADSRMLQMHCFSLQKYVDAISSKIIILFFISFAIIFGLSKTVNDLKENFFVILAQFLILVGLFLLIAWVADTLHNGKKQKIVRSFVLLVYLGLFIASLFFGAIIIQVIIVLALILAILYYYANKKRDDFETVLFTIFISATLAFMLFIIAVIIMNYGALQFMGNYNALILVLIMSPTIFILILTYFIISEHMFRKIDESLSEKNTEKITGRSISKKQILIKTSLIYLISMLLLSAMILASGIKYSDIIYRQITDKQKSIAETVGPDTNSEVRYMQVLENKGYKQIRTYIVIKKSDGAYQYGTTDLNRVINLQYDCDADLNCKEKQFNPSNRLEDQAEIKGKIFFVVQKDATTWQDYTLIIPPYMSEEEVLDRGLFEFENAGLRESTIALQINSDWKKINKETAERTVYPPTTAIQKMKYFLEARIWEDLSDQILFTTRIGIKLSVLREMQKTAKIEHAWIEKVNKQEMQEFYDNTRDIEEHTQLLKENIEELQKISESIKVKPAETTYSELGLYGAGIIRLDSYSPIYELIINEIEEHLDAVQSINSFIKKRSDMIKELLQEMIDQYNKELEETATSKAIRLKIIESLMAKSFVYPYYQCETEECKNRIIEITKNPYNCRELDEDEARNQCIIKYSKYDKEACKEIYDSTLNMQCLLN